MIRTILRYDSVDRLPLGDLAVRLAPVAEAIQSEVIAGGALGIADLPDGIKGTFRFDARDPRAMAWAQARGGALIRDLSDGARMQARSVIAQSVENGWTTAETADELQRTIGLHDRWARAVSNAWPREYDRLLSSGLSEAEAKRRATEFTDRYRQRLIRARAENIARTEVMQASNQGRWLSWAQGVEGGYVTSTAKKKWLTGPLVTRTPSRKQVCDVCRGLRDEVVPWDKPFSNGQMMPPAHPSCRCTAALVPPSEEEIDALLQANPSEADKVRRTASGVDWDEPVPTFGSTAEAEAWARQKWGVKADGSTRDIRFGNTHPEFAQKFTEEMDRLFKRYPQVADSTINRIGSAQAFKTSIGRNTAGHASRYDKMLEWNENHYGRSIAQVRGQMSAMKTARWLASDNPAGTLSHEFGHHIHYFIENMLKSKEMGWDFRPGFPADYIPGLKKEVSRILRQTLGLKGNFGLGTERVQDMLISELSRYGTTNWKELIAEAFAESMDDRFLTDPSVPPPRRVAQAILKWIDDTLGQMKPDGTI